MGECRLIWLMFASPSTDNQDVDSYVLLPLVSCWSPGQVPTSAGVGSTVVEHPASLSTYRQQSSDAFGRTLKYTSCRLPLYVLQRLLMWRIINAHTWLSIYLIYLSIYLTFFNLPRPTAATTA